MTQSFEESKGKHPGEMAYNVTEWGLSLENISYKLGRDWTMEGWLFLQQHGGAVWDTRNGPNAQGALATISARLVPNGAMGPTSMQCHSHVVPLKTWVHLAWQLVSWLERLFVFTFMLKSFPAFFPCLKRLMSFS